MNPIIRHKFIQEGNESIIVLYMDYGKFEFSNEFGIAVAESRAKLNTYMREYIKKHLPNTQATTIKLVTGTVLFSTLYFGTVNPKVEAADFNMSYLFFGSTSEQIAYVDRTNKAVGTVSPSYFDLNPDGSLKLSYQFSEVFIKEMKSRGVRVVPMLSNHWDREVGRSALTNREQLAQQVANTIIKYNLDGVNVDIENVTDVDRANYTDFVRRLREKLPADKELSVAVAANPNGWQKGWHGSYDYKELARYSDYLMIMSYDESYSGGPAGPVASFNWVERSVQYAINQGIPPEKIVLGIPFFGRYWNDQEATGGRGIAKSLAEQIVHKYQGKIIYDEATKSVRGTFTIKETDPVSKVNGRILTNGNYTIWFENEKSIKAKVDLVHKYKLKGTGSWGLGQENPVIWNNYKAWLEGYPFYDISNHWAVNEIISVNKSGWMKGVGNDRFAPEEAVTRAQAAIIISRALNLQPKPNNSTNYTDIKEGHYAENDIKLVIQNGIMNGMTNDKFSPDAPLTREQFSMIVDRILLEKNVVQQSDGDSKSPFQDVKSERWSKPSIVRMNKLGIIQGKTATTFSPTEPLTRAEMAVMMDRANVYIVPQ